jgi:signal transduction histidine kinase
MRAPVNKLVDQSLGEVFTRFRAPAMAAIFAFGLLIDIKAGFPMGPVPGLVFGMNTAHALYARVEGSSDTALGLVLDALVFLFVTWLAASTLAIMSFALMFVVLASLLLDGVQRTVVIGAVFIAAFAAVTLPYAGHWSPGVSRFYDVVALNPAIVVIVVLSMVTKELRNAELQRGYVVGTVAHELRNDLTPVVGMTSMLLDELTRMGRPDLAEMAGVAAAQATTASETIEDLLTLARIDREALGLDLRPINLGEAVLETIERYGVGGHVALPVAGRVQAIADPHRVRQIVRNLCANAQRYGGGEIDVVVDPDQADGCHVLVRDDGPGIPEADLCIVFEPFGRGAAGRANHASVGLGLWLSRELARAMDGDLTYRREDGWTVFDLRLPAGEAPAMLLRDPVSAG